MHMSDHLKQQIKGKMQERARIEACIEECSARLQASGVGLKSKLVDAQGFPRADIDVPAARADRQTIAMLTNDHKAMTALIEQLMYELHTEAKKAASSAQQEPIGRVPQATASHACPPSSNTASPPQLPFAVVDEVSSSSPAEEAGMLVGDQLVSFAHITKQTPDTLPAVAAALQANENKAVLATMLRRGSEIELQVTPHTWMGRGLLGCHMKPLV